MDFTYGPSDNAPDFVEAGTYPATVKKATAKVSKSGNNMMEIIWRLDNGFEMFDHVVDHSHPLCRKKSDQFLVAIGKEAVKGTKVEVDADELQGQRADLIIIRKDDGKNEVEGYAVSTSEAPQDGKGPF